MATLNIYKLKWGICKQILRCYNSISASILENYSELLLSCRILTLVKRYHFKC